MNTIRLLILALCAAGRRHHRRAQLRRLRQFVRELDSFAAEQELRLMQLEWEIQDERAERQPWEQDPDFWRD